MPASYGIERGSLAGALSWDMVSEQLAGARTYWTATTRRGGRPHVMPVWGLWMDDTFYFSTDPTSQKGRDLEANPYSVVHLESGDDVVIVEGTVERVSDTALLAPFVEAYETKYRIRLDLTTPGYGVYRLRPATVFAWREKDFPTSATRWRFDPGQQV